VDSILFNGRVTTLDPAKPSASAVASDSGVFAAVGDDREILALRTPQKVVKKG
jgi:predicted amidohydrolase YtcJ